MLANERDRNLFRTAETFRNGQNLPPLERGPDGAERGWEVNFKLSRTMHSEINGVAAGATRMTGARERAMAHCVRSPALTRVRCRGWYAPARETRARCESIPDSWRMILAVHPLPTPRPSSLRAVSYTHLTLPTKRIV